MIIVKCFRGNVFKSPYKFGGSPTFPPLWIVIPCVNSSSLTDLAAFHLSYSNASHFYKPQKLPRACWQVGRLNTAFWWKWQATLCLSCREHEYHVLAPALLPFSPLYLLPLSLLLVPTLLPRWGLFWTWKSHIPEGLCGPSAVEVSQIDAHANTHTCTRRHTNFHPHAPMFPTNTHQHTLPVILTSAERLGPEEAAHRSPNTGAAWHCGYQNTRAGLCCFYLFFLCLLSIDVDNHPLFGLSQEGSFFLPFQGNLHTVRAEATMCSHISQSLCLAKIAPDTSYFEGANQKSRLKGKLCLLGV